MVGGETQLVAVEVDSYLRQFFDDKIDSYSQNISFQRSLEDAKTYSLAGGKRLRAAFCYWTAVACGADGAETELIRLCSAVELLHAFALIHDDVMDHSETRRGNPTPHAKYASDHYKQDWAGDRGEYGVAKAILLGDLLYSLANELADSDRPDVRFVWNALATEVVLGQTMEIEAQAQRIYDSRTSTFIAEYKSGKYSVERPMQLGAAFAGSFDKFEQALTDIGVPLGLAFQLRDDLLGVFGTEKETGKPVGDDIIEGKPTVLLSYALDKADESERIVIRKAIGNSDKAEAASAIDVMKNLDVKEHFENQVDLYLATAVEKIQELPFTDEGETALLVLADLVANRDS